jgi:hypothetical protein
MSLLVIVVTEPAAGTPHDASTSSGRETIMNAQARMQGRPLRIAGASMAALLAVIPPAAAAEFVTPGGGGGAGVAVKPMMQLYVPPKATVTTTTPSNSFKAIGTTVPTTPSTPTTPTTPAGVGPTGPGPSIPSFVPNKPVGIPTTPDRPTVTPRQPPMTTTTRDTPTTSTPQSATERPTTWSNTDLRGMGNLGQVTSINSLLAAPSVNEAGLARQIVPNKLENRLVAPLPASAAADRAGALRVLDSAKPLM